MSGKAISKTDSITFEIISGKSGEYSLPAVLDIVVAGKFKNDLMQAANQDKDVKLNAGEVSRITTPCVQVIIALAKMFKESGRKLLIDKPSDTFCAAFADLGLAYELENWSVENA